MLPSYICFASDTLVRVFCLLMRNGPMPPMPALQSLEHLLLSENPLQEVRKGRICPKRERQVWRGSLKVSKWCNRDLQHCYRDVCFRARQGYLYGRNWAHCCRPQRGQCSCRDLASGRACLRSSGAEERGPLCPPSHRRHRRSGRASALPSCPRCRGRRASSAQRSGLSCRSSCAPP